MDREIKGFPAALAILQSLYDMPPHRVHKCEVLYDYASRVKNGVIVELGTYRGCGALALAMGAQDGYDIQVITIDDYIVKQGWAGEKYVVNDLLVFNELRQSWPPNGVAFILADAREMGVWITPSVGLLLHDLGVPDRLLDDLLAWKDKIVPGGWILIHDTFDKQLGSAQAVTALKDEFALVEENPGFTILEKIA